MAAVRESDVRTRMAGLALILAILLAGQVTCFEVYQQRIPNGQHVQSPCHHGGLWRGVGHTVPQGGGRRNPFGQDFQLHGKMWTKALCHLDSDGDGRTNGEELGDPHCAWQPGSLPMHSSNITHPGICEPLDSPECTALNGWLRCDVSTFHCDAVKEAHVMSLDLRIPETEVPGQETSYYCMLFDLPDQEDLHMVATQPIVDNSHVVHHILLFGCRTDDPLDLPDVPYPCGMLPHRQCLEIIGTWTIGSPGECIHPDVGFRVGRHGYSKVALQIHWNNPGLVTNYTDASGLRIFYTAERRPNDAGMLVVGEEYLEIPPRSPYAPTPPPLSFHSVCPSHCTQEMFRETIFITGTINHMHYLGTAQRIELYREGQKVRDITHDKIFSYDNPVIYTFNPPIEVRPGDEIRTTCMYKSHDSGDPVCYGDATSDEMCFGFITYYPQQRLARPWCTTRKSVHSCYRHLPKFLHRPIDGCPWKEFLNFSSPSTVQILTSVVAHCYGADAGLRCSDRCMDAVKTARAHPCLSGDVGSYIMSKLRQVPVGHSLVNALYTCDCQKRHHVGYCDRRSHYGMMGENSDQLCRERAAKLNQPNAASRTSVLASVVSLALIGSTWSLLQLVTPWAMS